jgi:SAM-dependent methyltransferase
MAHNAALSAASGEANLGCWCVRRQGLLVSTGKWLRRGRIRYSATQRLSTYIGNVEEAHTLPRGPYDAVILAEVLEHLRNDATALRNLRGLLGPDGILILTVPFFDDRPEWHIRIYSPRSIKRLLEACGFRVVDMYFRPFPFPICLRKLINTIIHGINAASYIISGRTVYHRLLPILWALYILGTVHEVL